MITNLIKSSFAGAALVAAASFAAQAADMPLKAPPMIAPAWSWTGFYIGANGGAGFGQADQTLNIPGIPSTYNFPSQPISGFLGGAQVGYNWQMSNLPVVLGIEGDWDWTNLNGSGQCTLPGLVGGINVNCNVKTNWIADVTGRIGFTADRALIYVKGGVAWAQNDYNGSIFPVFVGIPVTANETKMGGLLGFGVEYAVWGNWSAKVEYDFIDFGSSTNTLTVAGTPIPAGDLNLGVRQTVSEVKFGINYRWNPFGY